MQSWTSSRLKPLSFCLLGLSLTFPGCSGRQTPERPSGLLLVTIDTLRADRLGVYGWEAARTPNLDRLAASGRHYRDVFTPVPVTLPAHTSLLTGRLPFRHGVRNNSFYVLPQEETTMAEALRGAGFQTGAVVAAAVLDHRFGLDQGFDSYDDEIETGNTDVFIAERSASEVTSRALDWLETLDSTRPFFLWVHYFDPHDPYHPPQRHQIDGQGPTYDDEIAFVDEQIGRLIEGFKRRGVWHKTLAAVTSDHGEGLGEHGEETHGIFLYDSTLRVPLILSGPGIHAQTPLPDFPIGLVDLFPTLLAAMGVEAPHSPDGLDILRSGASRESLYAETFLPNDFYNWSKLTALRWSGWKYVQAPEPELYDLKADPAEERSLATRDPSRVSTMAAELSRISVEQDGAKAEQAVPTELLEQVASLGYVSMTPRPRDSAHPTQPLPDPKTMVHLVAELDAALASIRKKNLKAGISRLRDILEADPTNFLATHSLADALYDAGQAQEAIQSYHRTLELGREAAYYHYRLGLLYEQTGRHAQAADHFSRLIQRNSSAAQETLERGDSLLERGLAKEALGYFEAVAKGGVQDPLVDLSIASALLQMEQTGRAQSRLEAAANRYPESVPVKQALVKILNLRGTTQGNRGNLKGALEFFLKATRLSSADFDSWANLALTYLRTGQKSDAMEPLRQAIQLRPDSVRLLNLLGELHFQRGEYASAKRLLVRSLELDPGQTRIAQALAEVERRRGASP